MMELKTNVQSLMEINVYAVKGRVLIVGACFPQIFPEAFLKLSAGVDQIYSLCLETTHINMAVTKLSVVKHFKTVSHAVVFNGIGIYNSIRTARRCTTSCMRSKGL